MSDDDRPHDRYCEWWGECWCNPDPYGEDEKRKRREAEARRPTVIICRGFAATLADECRHAWVFTSDHAECGYCGVGEPCLPPGGAG